MLPAVVAYVYLQPLRRVIRRTANPCGKHFHNETLECGHTLVKQRAHKLRGQPHYLPDHRRCPVCPPDPPPLKGVEVILDESVPYTPGDGRRPGFQYVNEGGRLSLKPTRRVRMHPAYHATLTPEAFRRTRVLTGLVHKEWVCEVCGARGRNPGGKGFHQKAKHPE